ncbi:MAG: mediator complex subunit [Trichoglossum hirsutum]|nr:MAG: mediator complex subunit [Trichoglossum hirsutum]
MGGEVEIWKKFLHRNLLARTPAVKFEDLVKVLSSRYPLPGSSIADVFLEPRSEPSPIIDPLLPLYVERLLNLDLIDGPDVLRVLLRNSHLHDSTGQGRDGGNGFENSLEFEDAILSRVARFLASAQRPKNIPETWATLSTVSRWMSAIVTADVRDDMMDRISGGAGATGVQPDAMALREAVGNLVLAISGNPKILDIRENFARSLSMFVPFLSQTALQLAARLETFRKEYFSMFDGNQSKTIGDGGDNVMGVDVSTLELHDPMVQSRAGLYIYLNSLLVGCPKVDDGMILNYMHCRYKADISTMAIDLVIASFDILSNAMFRNEHTQTILLLRSFLVNKLPLLLTTLSSSMFPPLTPELCIAQALNHIDPQAFPTFSSMFESDASMFHLTDVRQEFLFACCLHELIPEDSIERLLGEIPVQTLPPGGRYINEQLVAQCATDPERVEGLLGEIEGMDGNAGAVVGAVTEVVHNLCTAKETMSLKTIAGFLARKPSSLDVMLLFSKPASILQPICHLLDTWRYDEDQDEYQPVYEEFGYILLLVLAIVYRYRLTVIDLGLQNEDSFVTNLLRRGSVSQKIEDLTTDQSNQLGDWIRGIFDVDIGFNNEIMASCPPQDFYLLVPTLFSQSVSACNANIMDMEALKSGLEYLRETFLITSLVGAITWLTNNLWESRGDVNVLMQILQSLIKPKSISGEAEMMHDTILSIIAKPLEHALRELRRSAPSRQDIDPLLHALQPHLAFRRTAGSHHTELESWTSTHGGGMLASLRNTFQSLVLWSTTPDINMTPASYSHRQVLVAVKMLGARSVIRTIIDEVKLQNQIQNSSGDLSFDIATAIICAPGATDGLLSADGNMLGTYSLQNHSGRLNLREALRLELEDASKISSSDPARAETIVRLHRRVEAQLDMGHVSNMIPDLNVTAQDANSVGDIDLTVGGGSLEDVLGADHDMLGGGDLLGVGVGSSMDLS